MSDSMLSATPGYWIFMATCRPSRSVARCTCPMLAAAIGSSTNSDSCARHSGPSSLASTWWSWFVGITSAPWRTRSSAFWICGGMTDSSWIDSICPSFSAAPRMRQRDTWSVGRGHQQT